MRYVILHVLFSADNYFKGFIPVNLLYASYKYIQELNVW